jgi:hypothetical protein
VKGLHGFLVDHATTVDTGRPSGLQCEAVAYAEDEDALVVYAAQESSDQPQVA